MELPLKAPDTYKGAKADKHCRGMLQSHAVMLSFLAVMIPLAFVGGYSAAFLTSACKTQCHRHYGLASLPQSGATGRLLSHHTTMDLIEAGNCSPSCLDGDHLGVTSENALTMA